MTQQSPRGAQRPPVSNEVPPPPAAPVGFARFEPPVLSTTPGRVAVAPGLEIREASITLAVHWLKSDPTTDADRLFTAADMIGEYIRTGAHPVKPEE